MNGNKFLKVFIDNKEVGTLALMNDYRVAFEYSDFWLENAYSISPFSLPLKKGIFIPKSYNPFDGLFGLFSDSLPDGWGRLLVDRVLIRNGHNLDDINSLDRLAIVNKGGMGALEYRPYTILESKEESLSIDEMAKECELIFEDKDSKALDELFKRGGSSGGARPKVYIEIEGAEYLVKFPAKYDNKDIGLEEYDYMSCAKRCGINTVEFRLIESDISKGYFASKRFDRDGTKKVHMISVSALLETHRIVNLDYDTLLRLTFRLTDDIKEVEELYRRMCFNVFSHNRDDHSKNFSFLYKDNRWQLSPAYDLTYSNSINGEHATTINGNGKNPSIDDLVAVAVHNNIGRSKALSIISLIKEETKVLKKYQKR